MIFSEMPIDECAGAFLVHAVRTADGVLKKGHNLGTREIALLRAAGVSKVFAAKLEKDDVAEDIAATRLANALLAEGLRADPAFTGRVNLFAEKAGVIQIDKKRIDAINAIDEAVTVASVSEHSMVGVGQMVATVKIIPFSVPDTVLARCLAAASANQPALSLSPFRSRPVALIHTILPTLKPSIVDKTTTITNQRLSAAGCEEAVESRCSHETGEIATALGKAIESGAELVLVMGASAITDRRDVIPAAILAAGGRIEQFGMPVDPGNLLLLAEIGNVPVLGLPGCARSPKPNGFDWVLQRLLADLKVHSSDLRAMGVGGLLMEIPTRPQPRAGAERIVHKPPHVVAIILAAGKSSRMGQNKLLLDDSGQPIIATTVDHAMAAGVAKVIVVVGHERGAVCDALAGRKVEIVVAADFASGMSASLKAGIEAVPTEADAVIVMLGDMPRTQPQLLRRLISAYQPLENRSIVVPTQRGKRGNPVLWDRRYFAEMSQLSGDVGARHLIGEHADQVAEIEVSDSDVFLDVDTPEVYERLRSRSLT